jgi:hypothetical protein
MGAILRSLGRKARSARNGSLSGSDGANVSLILVSYVMGTAFKVRCSWYSAASVARRSSAFLLGHSPSLRHSLHFRESAAETSCSWRFLGTALSFLAVLTRGGTARTIEWLRLH